MKKISILFCALLLFFAFSGCERKANEEINPESPQKQERLQIIFYNLFDPEDVFKGQIQAYESANKHIDIVYKKFHNVAEYEWLLLNQLAEGGGPDIFAIRNDWLPRYKGKLTPAFANTFIPEQFAETFLGVAVDDLVAPDADGFDQVWGVPLYIDTLALYYNKDLFRDQLPSSDTPAATWEEIKEQVFGLTKTDNSIERFAVSGMAMGHATNISQFEDILSLLLIQQGARLFDETQERAIFAKSQGTLAGTGKPFFPTLEAIKLYTSFAIPSYKHASWNLPITGLYPNEKEVGAFVRGKAGMIFGFSSLYEEIQIVMTNMARNNEPIIQMESVGIAPVPQFSTSIEAGEQDAFAKYYPLVVSRNALHADEAWKFLEFLSSPESLTTYHQETKKPSPRRDMIEEQSIERLFGVFARQVPYAKSLQTFDSKSFFEIWTPLIENIVKNRLSPEQGVQKAETQMNCILEKKQKPEIDTNCFSL